MKALVPKFSTDDYDDYLQHKFLYDLLIQARGIRQDLALAAKDPRHEVHKIDAHLQLCQAQLSHSASLFEFSRFETMKLGP